MIYRTLGRTGLSVSEIGLGCEGFQTPEITEEILAAAEEGGVNYIDVYTSDPAMRSNLGEALKHRSKPFMIQGHLCTTWKDNQYKRTRKMDEVKASFEDLLTRLKREYVDVGMIHYVDSFEDWEIVQKKGVMDYAKEQKRRGRIRFIGLSSHNPTVAKKAVESGLIDVLMFSVNPCYDLLPANEDLNPLFEKESYNKTLINMDPDRQSLYETCNRLGVGITVMKAFAGGDLLDETRSPAGKALTVNQCIHYALTRPAVVSVLTGVHSAAELSENLAYETATETEKDYALAFASFPKISWKGHCMYCGHCAPCAKGIDIASVTKFYHLALTQQKIPETVREHYASLPHTASECIACGQCESRCPFSVPIMENMKKAAALFGK